MLNLPSVTPATAIPPASGFLLSPMIRSLMKSFVPLAVAKGSFIVNEVDPALRLQVDEQVLAYAIGNLLSNAISSTKNACIRLEATKEAGEVSIRVRMNATNFHTSVSGGYAQVLEAAYLLGGNIHIYNQRHEGMVFSLSLAA